MADPQVCHNYQTIATFGEEFWKNYNLFPANVSRNLHSLLCCLLWVIPSLADLKELNDSLPDKNFGYE